MPIDDGAEPNGRSPKVQNEAANPLNVFPPTISNRGVAPADLISASKVELTSIYNQLKKDLKPRGPIELMYVETLTHIVWDIRRLRKIKDSLLRYEMQPALADILEHILAVPVSHRSINTDRQPKALADGWNRDKTVQAEVAKILDLSNLDANNIEAEAWRRLSHDMDLIERQLTSLEHRFSKQLIALADYRDVLVHRLKLKVQPILAAEGSFEADPSYETGTPADYSQLS